MALSPPFATYAIGDIHGRLDLLRRAAATIRRHAAGRRHRVICLGDYVDRGPDSRGVVETLMALERREGWICLKGNHEAMMVEALRTGAGRGAWLENGGRASLASYGHPPRVPDLHLDWLADLELLLHEAGPDGGRLYVHAGVRPGVPLAEQDPDALMWIRERFLAAPADALPCHVAHGHTPSWLGKPDPSRPELLAHRTNLDTGACWTGVLTVGVFHDDRAGGPAGILTVTGEPG